MAQRRRQSTTTKSTARTSSQRTRARSSKSKAPPPAPAAPLPAASRQTRKATLIALLSRPEGAVLSELTAATAWQSHSVRAAITHFRQAGFVVTRTRDEGGTARYQLQGA
ncbi:MAG: DUF3489 domain-containing protein [Gammaproteobacteria bacterium]|jgi:hypothetical protein|nr:DUF3489 domain-containing protein [Gammaproteobacteria bacterium]